MPAIGSTCHELRINDRDRTWRIVHAIEEGAVVILEVFSKKTDQTPSQLIEICKKRLKAYRDL
jgi:phage-related protein